MSIIIPRFTNHNSYYSQLSKMFSLRTLITLSIALTAFPLSLAKVFDMSAPVAAQAGTKLTAVLYTESYIQNWDDLGVCPFFNRIQFVLSDIQGHLGSDAPCQRLCGLCR